MPTYEYECSKGHQFEVEQSINDPALQRCKLCRAKVAPADLGELTSS